MRTKILMMLCVFYSSMGLAENSITAEKLRTSIELQVQSVVMSADGKRFINPNLQSGSYRSQVKTGELTSTWINSEVNLDFSLKIDNEKRMTLSITEYQKAEIKNGEVVKSGKGRSETFEMTNFESVSWVTKKGDTSIITRFVPFYVGKDDLVILKGLPLSMTNMIVTDNSGRVWSEGASAIGEVVKFGTKYGSIYLSFTEFKGSKEIGTAEGSLVEISLSERLTLRVRSTQPILGKGILAKIYGKYIPSDKAEKWSSIEAMSADKAETRVK